MKKFFLTCAYLLCTVIVLLFISYLSRSYILSQVLSGKLGARVHVEKIDYSNQTITIENIRVENPTQSSLENAITIKKVIIVAPLSEYFRKKMVIQLIDLQEIDLFVEFYDKAHKVSNWNIIMDKMNSKKKEEAKKDGKSSMIREMDLGPINITIKFPGAKPKKQAPLPQLRFKNVTADNGELTDKIIEAIISHLMPSLKGIIELPLKAAKGSLDLLIKPLEGLFKNKNEEEPTN